MLCRKNEINNCYDIGYEAAWRNEPLYFETEEVKNGYRHGIDDADAYDNGYEDAKNKKRPRDPKDCFYMDGYRDGKTYSRL